VPAEALAKIFEMFYRVGNASEKHPGGTGFGLAITQRIVAMHGGAIVARNLTPRGLEVRIELPLAVSREAM
jgi:two-component system sensor histidine kinase CpxA